MAIYRGPGGPGDATADSASTAQLAQTYATNAENSATAAASSASAASSSASSASASASAASSSATAASASASSASTSETNASNSATAAAASASAAATSEANAGTSETNAAASASAASTSESNAATSETNAANSATSASNSASSASTSATNAAASYDSFDDRYLGAKASAPSVDNDGDALLTGALYWNTSSSSLFIWTGSAWSPAAFDASGAVTSFNTRTGAVTLTSTDVTDALTFTPLGSSDIGVTVQAFDADTAKYDDTTANFTGTLQNGGHTVLTNASDYLDSADIGVTVQGYDVDTAKYDDTTANFTGTLQNGGSNVLVDTDIGSTVQSYDADTAKLDVAQSFTAQQTFAELKETTYTLGTTGSIALDPANGSIQSSTLTGNPTFTDSLEAGQTVVLMLNGGASYTVTWPTTTWVTNAGNTAPTLTANDTLVFWKVSTTLYGAYVGSYT